MRQPKLEEEVTSSSLAVTIERELKQLNFFFEASISTAQNVAPE
jgi:hypothetical protein